MSGALRGACCVHRACNLPVGFDVGLGRVRSVRMTMLATWSRIVSRPKRRPKRGGRRLHLVALALAPMLVGPLSASAQTLSIPSSTDPKCPPVTRPLGFGTYPVQTPAWVIRQWLTKFRQEIPDASDSKLLAAVEPKTHLAWCVVPRDPAPATPGLGVTADAAIVIVTPAGTDEVARLDSFRYYVAMPPNTAKGVDPLPDGALFGATLRIVTPIPRTTPTDKTLVDLLSSAAFADDNTIVGVGPEADDQPGRLRTERLVVADPCGVFALSVGVRDATIEVFEGSIEPPTCPGAPLRSVLLQRPNVSVDGDTLTLIAAGLTVSLRASRPTPFRTARITRYANRAESSTRSISTTVVGGPLRRADIRVACNSMWTWIAFSADRFVIDPRRMVTAVACRPAPKTAASLFAWNMSGTGTWARHGNTLTMRFVDGGVATFTLQSDKVG